MQVYNAVVHFFLTLHCNYESTNWGLFLIILQNMENTVVTTKWRVKLNSLHYSFWNKINWTGLQRPVSTCWTNRPVFKCYMLNRTLKKISKFHLIFKEESFWTGIQSDYFGVFMMHLRSVFFVLELIEIMLCLRW